MYANIHANKSFLTAIWIYIFSLGLLLVVLTG
jgi:hypothetical protein